MFEEEFQGEGREDEYDEHIRTHIPAPRVEWTRQRGGKKERMRRRKEGQGKDEDPQQIVGTEHENDGVENEETGREASAMYRPGTVDGERIGQEEKGKGRERMKG